MIYTLSEEAAHPTVNQHLSQLSVDIQLNGLITMPHSEFPWLPQNFKFSIIRVLIYESLSETIVCNLFFFVAHTSLDTMFTS